MTEYEDVRIQSGLMKAEQIKATQASIVATTCANYRLQLNDLHEHIQLGLKSVSVTDLNAAAMVDVGS